MSDYIKSFSKQDQALEHSKLKSELHVFSREFDCRGRRTFLVTSIPQFWQHYQTQSTKTFYEVIPEGKCKLHLDLEFSREKNQNETKNGEQMSKLLISKLLECLKNIFNHKSDLKDVLVLDSSNSFKYSSHVIFTKTYFSDNRDIGEFLNVFNTTMSMAEKEFFEVQNKEKIESFIDDKIYSRNRNFRLIGSCKFGKSTPLIVSRFDEHSQQFSSLPEAEAKFLTFKSSLVTNIEEELQTIDVHSRKNQLKAGINHTRVCSTVKGHGPSPYPELDTFVQSQLPAGACIRAWDIRAASSSVLYNIGGRSFCRIVNREHTRNNIYMVCDLSSMTLVQRCHSQSCKGLKGLNEIPIPSSVMSWQKDFFDDF